MEYCSTFGIWLFAALFDLHLQLIINVLSSTIPRERLPITGYSIQLIEAVVDVDFGAVIRYLAGLTIFFASFKAHPLPKQHLGVEEGGGF